MKLKKIEHKKFDYKPRYYKGDGNPYKFKHKFDEFRTSSGGNISDSKGKLFDQHRTLKGDNNNIKSKINSAFEEFKNSENGGLNPTLLITIAVLILVFLYIIDFDLSIFT